MAQPRSCWPALINKERPNGEIMLIAVTPEVPRMRDLESYEVNCTKVHGSQKYQNLHLTQRASPSGKVKSKVLACNIRQNTSDNIQKDIEFRNTPKPEMKSSRKGGNWGEWKIKNRRGARKEPSNIQLKSIPLRKGTSLLMLQLSSVSGLLFQS